jgi:hypothetical protein
MGSYSWLEKKQILFQGILPLFPKSIRSFFEFGPTEFNEPFRATLKGLKEPENDQNDQFLLKKPYNLDSTLGKVDFLYIFKDDEIFQSFNIFDIPKLKFDNS